MEVAKTATGFLRGEKLYHKRARKVLPILIRQALASQTICYSDLAEEVGMPNPRNLDYPLGSIGNALEELSLKLNINIPQIQCIVVGKNSGIPGDGFGGFIEEKDFKKLSKKQKKVIVDSLAIEAFTFNRWIDVLSAFDLKQADGSLGRELSQKAGKKSHSGESDQHKAFKKRIARKPCLVGIKNKSFLTETEYTFPSMDAMDVSIKVYGKWIGVEVKSVISPKEDILRGLYQCVKYQALMEAFLAVEGENMCAEIILAVEGEFPRDLIPVRNVLGIKVVDNIPNEKT